MNQFLSMKSSKVLNNRANRLKSLLVSDPDAAGQLYDARMCNNISIDLYELRKRSGLTQKELAEKLQVKQSNISRWEKPGYQGYKIKMLSKITRILGGQLFISIQPLKTIQYFHETFEMQHESNTASFHPDGSFLMTSNKFKIRYEGVGVKLNAS